jgi:hypothetical protein
MNRREHGQAVDDEISARRDRLAFVRDHELRDLLADLDKAIDLIGRMNGREAMFLRTTMQRAIDRLCEVLHAFADTNRHLVEVPDTFAIARWPLDADVATIARCMLGTLKYEPRGAGAPDITALRRALEALITETAR